jgi:prophage antirepressor-like protein
MEIEITRPTIEQATRPIVSGIATFQFNGNPIRVETIDAVEFFVARDIAPILGFRNARQAVRTHVTKGDRRGVRILDTPGGPQTLLAVNESGLYALILGSKKPEALAFRQWVTAEILPTLRKSGRYELRQGPQLLDQIIRMLRGRGSAKARQLNRVVAHRDGSISYRVGRHWVRRVPPAAVDYSFSHSLREGLAWTALKVASKGQLPAATRAADEFPQARCHAENRGQADE